MEQIKKEILRKRSLKRSRTPIPIYNIPIVFHVVYHEAIEDLDGAIILEQVDSINRDFRNRNIDDILFEQFQREK